MKKFESFSFNPNQARIEIERFRQLLSSKNDLSETGDLLPLFKKNRHLIALLGTFNNNITDIDRVAHEFDLFGDFVCDFAVGDSSNHAYCFIEFEDATKYSVFSPSPRPSSEWGRRFEKGFSQIVDWSLQLDQCKVLNTFRNRFGSNTIDSHSVLIVGRAFYVDDADQERLLWRKSCVTVNTQKISCMTYDHLLEEMDKYMRRYP
jgi:hypothetical protein